MNLHGRRKRFIEFALVSLLLIITSQVGEAGWANWAPFPNDQDGPGNLVVVRRGWQTYAFRRLSDRSIYTKSHLGDSWGDWSMIPGSSGSLVDPAVGFFGVRLVMFTVMPTTWRSSGFRPDDTFIFPKDKALYMTWWTSPGGNWHSWVKVPGMTTSDSPAAIQHRNRNYLFVRDPEGRIQFSTYKALTSESGEWSTWSEVPLGGFIASGSPAVASVESSDEERLYLFARNATDGTIHLTVFNGLCWSGWKRVPGSGEIPGTSAVSPAAAAAPLLGGVYLFVAGVGDRRIYQNTLNDNDADVDWDDSDWNGWAVVPGPRTTSARLASSAAGIELNLFVLDDTDQLIYMNNLQP